MAGYRRMDAVPEEERARIRAEGLHFRVLGNARLLDLACSKANNARRPTQTLLCKMLPAMIPPSVRFKQKQYMPAPCL